ncbi:expressed unknown protein [Seminavis robusta]|uniref:Uncharacterized protein n=1 Tax=Seminavis robusta TaxID=568900 RepID=A0A9N8HU28_9STRA|nr:expressed unknown protein [Seminavis robusta]|eukprot:Sro1747_g295060.1 n/a (296) ;mRNA; r:17061-18027
MVRPSRRKLRLTQAANGGSRGRKCTLPSLHTFVTMALFAVVFVQQLQHRGQIAPPATVTSAATSASPATTSTVATATAAMATTASQNWWEKPQPLLSDWPDLLARTDMHKHLELLKLKRGAEVGVQRGLLARRTLETWKSCEKYALVGLWGDEAGSGPDTNIHRIEHLDNARQLLEPYEKITDFYVMRSTDAAKKFEKGYFDYVYIDASDYCAIAEDIDHYWPTLRPGGIMAGHDFVDEQYVMDRLGSDWPTKCENGSNQPRSARGAVEAFAKKHNLNIKTTQEKNPTWLIQKPY